MAGLPHRDKREYLEAQLQAVRTQLYRTQIDEEIYKVEYQQHRDEMSPKSYEEKLKANAVDITRFETAIEVLEEKLEELENTFE